MISLKSYLRLERLARSSPDLGCAFDKVFDLYRDRQRISGRLVIQHCLETGEITSHFTTDPAYMITAVFHDLREDLGLSFENVKRICGKDGMRIAEMVTALTKRSDLKDREAKNREYLSRLSKAIEADQWLGVIKVADRISNLADIQALPPEKRKAIANQTLSFYVPIALRLGLVGLANTLKELSLPHVVLDSGFN